MLLNKLFISPHLFKYLSSKRKFLVEIKKSFQITSQIKICHKDNIDPVVAASNPAPWPYETKKYTWFHEILGLDNTTDRFNENTTVITIDGPPACGKTAFAAKLATELGMKHFKEPSLDIAFVTYYGFDYRTLNSFLPLEGQLLDVKGVVENPLHPRAGYTQHLIYKVRYFQYLDVLAHIFSTGQGVVMERSPWSDIVFMESMTKAKFVHKDILDFYHRKRNITLNKLLRPHLVIYLDAPVSQTIKNIKKRNLPYEVNSKVASSKYLTFIDDFYKRQFLPEISTHAELLVYDWAEDYNFEQIIEDIESIDFTKYEDRGSKMEDWRMDNEEKYNETRRLFTNKKSKFLTNFILPSYDVEGYDMNSEVDDIQQIVHAHLGDMYYQPGYHPKKESLLKILFRGPSNYRDAQNQGWFYAEP